MHPDVSMSRSWAPAKVKYAVVLYHAANDLHGSVEVIALTKKAAGDLAKREFFRGDGWKVVKVTQLEEPI